MSRRLSLAGLLAGLSIFTFHSPTSAALVDYVGFGWETGGYLPSNPGDVLEVVTVGTQIDPIFGALPADEITVRIHGLVSTGQFVDSGSGSTIVAYVGGQLDLYADPSQDHDWGVFPANASSPSSFMNGQLLFSGAFTSFTLFLSPSGVGVFEGTLDGIGGSALGSVCTDCAYSFSGVFSRSAGAQIPDGYDLQVDGTLDVDSSVPVARADSFGAVKSSYRD